MDGRSSEVSPLNYGAVGFGLPDSGTTRLAMARYGNLTISILEKLVVLAASRDFTLVSIYLHLPAFARSAPPPRSMVCYALASMVETSYGQPATAMSTKPLLIRRPRVAYSGRRGPARKRCRARESQVLSTADQFPLAKRRLNS